MINEESDAVSEDKHRHGNPVTSLKCAPVNQLIIYITMHKQKASIYKLSRSKALKHGKFRLTDIQEIPFSWYCMSVDFSSRNNFANLGSFAKVFVLI